MSKLLFGYKNVVSHLVSSCPCLDTGRYMSLEQMGDDPLHCRFRCWCGRTRDVYFDSIEERRAFLLVEGVKIEPV